MEARSCLVGWAAVMATVPPAIDEHGQRRPEEKSESPRADRAFCATPCKACPTSISILRMGPGRGFRRALRPESRCRCAFGSGLLSLYLRPFFFTARPLSRSCGLRTGALPAPTVAELVLPWRGQERARGLLGAFPNHGALVNLGEDADFPDFREVVAALFVLLHKYSHQEDLALGLLKVQAKAAWEQQGTAEHRICPAARRRG